MEGTKNYIVCFIDILGYKNIVLNDDEVVLSSVKEALDNAVFKLLKFIKEYKPSDNLPENEEQFISGTYESINIDVISDSIIIRMPLELESNTINVIKLWSFLFYVSFLIANFIYLTGLFIRGGISFGTHFECPINDETQNNFIFSKTLIQAYLLEKKAESIRILIDEPIVEYIKADKVMTGKYKNSDFLYQDVDKLHCLHFYRVISDKDSMYVFFPEYRRHIIKNITDNRHDIRVISKYVNLIKYHNDYMKSIKYDFNFIDGNILVLNPNDK
ncbi:MAG: hypothetical protein IAE93_08995 [Ignavibacteria bacterium]|nr:hypothetical protein [Ignavibacteria bacterium]